MKTRFLVAVVLLGALFAGCGGGGTPGAPNQVSNLHNNVLQFAVGTANLNGTRALNVVTTYRQGSGLPKPGDSGTALNSPTLTIPGTLPAAGSAANPNDPTSFVMTGPASAEAGGKSAGSTAQAPNSTTQTSFGQSGGVFGSGIEPFNAMGPYDTVSANNSGLPFEITPYPVPLFADSAPATVPPFVPWGGPPAYDILGNGTSILGNADFPQFTDNSGTTEVTAGVPLGIDVFAGVAPAAGSYTLAVSVPANTGVVNASASATMPAAPTVLGTAAAPAATFNGSGGATFAFTMPSGATEAIVEIVDAGNGGTNCNTASAAQGVYYTIKMTASGTATLGNAAGPGATPSICTVAQNAAVSGGTAAGDKIFVYTVGFDYPFVESSYPFSSGNPSPTIAGAGPTDDITISARRTQTSP